jgi:UDP-N-acetylglucosamine diphosphorylase/glucosamine-1-phosphate N-acetyltransferase
VDPEQARGTGRAPGEPPADEAGPGGIVLFEDGLAGRLGPLVLNRPVFDLVLGATTLRRRIERELGGPARAARVRPHLAALLPEAGLTSASERPGDFWVNAALGADPGPAWAAVRSLGLGEALRSGEGRLLALRVGRRGVPAAALSDPDEGGAALAEVGYAVRTADQARCLAHAWELIGWQVQALVRDLAIEEGHGRGGQGHGGQGHGGDVVAAGAQVEAPVFFDCRQGPIVVRPGARVAAFSRLEGPAWIGEGAQVLGGRVAGSYIGPGCRVRGEIEASVLLAWSNKAHEGFVGHSYIGSWVNLGALTTTSDLKNNYGDVRMREEGERRSTGLMKVGSILADHVKTAIGTLLGAGTVVGLGANLFGGGGVMPAWVPSFAWGVGERAGVHDLERFLQTAVTVYGRRQRTLSAAERSALAEAFATSAPEREVWLAQQAARGAAGR